VNDMLITVATVQANLKTVQTKIDELSVGLLQIIVPDAEEGCQESNRPQCQDGDNNDIFDQTSACMEISRPRLRSSCNLGKGKVNLTNDDGQTSMNDHLNFTPSNFPGHKKSPMELVSEMAGKMKLSFNLASDSELNTENDVGVWTMSVKLGELIYSGQGKNKKAAKQAAASAALENQNDWYRIIELPSLVSGKDLEIDKSPIQVLSDLASQVKVPLGYELIGEAGTSDEKIFTMTVKVGEKVYIGKGKNKKTAKQAASTAALKDRSAWHKMTTVQSSSETKQQSSVNCCILDSSQTETENSKKMTIQTLIKKLKQRQV